MINQACEARLECDWKVITVLKFCTIKRNK